MSKTLERSFKSFAPNWPSWLDDSYSAALAAWLELNDGERADAARLAKTYITTCKPCALGSYLKLHKWEGLEEVVTPSGKMLLKRFGPAWSVVRLQSLANGRREWKPTPIQQAMIDKGHADFYNVKRYKVEFPYVASLDATLVRIEPERMPPKEVLDRCKWVAIGSSEWVEWEDYHKAQDWPFIHDPKTCGLDGSWFPALSPRDLEAV